MNAYVALSLLDMWVTYINHLCKEPLHQRCVFLS